MARVLMQTNSSFGNHAVSSLSAQKGDITQAKVDVIVNAANPGLLGGGGVDGAIHRAAGPELLNYCRDIPEIMGQRCPPGHARITPGGKLACRYVIHTVGPRYNIDPEPEVLLKSAYINSLDLVLEYGCCSVALPAVSCGVYGYPAEEAAKIAVSVCCSTNYKNLDIIFYLFNDLLHHIWCQEILNRTNLAG